MSPDRWSLLVAAALIVACLAVYVWIVRSYR